MPKSETSDAEGSQGRQVSAGRRALADGDWKQAQASFEAALAEGESAEALAGLAEAAWWLDDLPAAMWARERAYHLYRRCDDLAAARLAMLLAVDHFSLRAEEAVASGWFQRASHLLEDLPAAPEHGWLAAWEAHVALAALRSDVARPLITEARAVGRALGVLDLEMLALAQEGLTAVWEGEVAAGMPRLDEVSAAATSGEVADRRIVATTYCYLIDACVAVGDFDRVAQWNHAMARDTDRWACPVMFSRCRVDYVPVLLWRGEWAQAEDHLRAVLDQAESQPAPGGRAAATLAELRRRQGRRQEAAALLDQAEATARRLVQASASLTRAELALDEWDAATALSAAERLLRTLKGGGPWQRVRALEVVVRVQLSLGEAEAARAGLEELCQLAAATGTDAVRAYCFVAEGLLAAADGEVAAAAQRLEDAVELFADSGAAYETARTRLERAGALAALGRPERAATEAASAFDALARLGAADAERAQELLQRLRGREQPEAGHAGGDATLSPRELEVLRLLAAGRSNREIAQDLYLSVRTVERHVSTIYRSLGVSGKAGRTAAVAAAVKAGVLAPPGR